ncbi:protein of unknown function [Nitrospina watsonii]|uniref:Uncharacterized protein n=1 Tax=Nitrospina watsonii TaxID=1323948 RepID=A0ABN8VUX4_9BACT|nr:protein of unknown function [Nitrospina watsonii]
MKCLHKFSSCSVMQPVRVQKRSDTFAEGQRNRLEQRDSARKRPQTIMFKLTTTKKMAAAEKDYIFI